ncbi:MAG TPA: ATP synthase F1 subunit gamma [Acidimicrobiales bacterium]|jgi:F-type H+-transporting ATPase subunit gamma|nr:ATP synthase F1 subunit gamma [Acidimicrobiales bacterium]
MAGGQERVLRRRIRSVQSTRKITKAMELIAASRIVRAQARIAANRPYRLGMERILRLTAAADPAAAEKLLGTPESPTRVGVLAIVGDRGLAGSYNSGVLRATERLVAEYQRTGAEVTVWSVGKKAPGYFRYRGIEIAQSFAGIADRPEFVDARAVAATVTAPFVAGEMDLVQMVSTRFISAGTQRVQTLQMLPLPLPEVDEEAAPGIDDVVGSSGLHGYTEFEPEPEQLLAELAPRAAESEIFAALLEGSASFFTAQQRAMAAATENADELVRTLTRVMNRARQDSITTEIMEIVGGAEALRQSKGA